MAVPSPPTALVRTQSLPPESPAPSSTPRLGAHVPFALQSRLPIATWTDQDDASTLYHAVRTHNLGQLVAGALIRLSDSPPLVGPGECLLLACDPRVVLSLTTVLDTAGLWRTEALRQQSLPALYAAQLEDVMPWHDEGCGWRTLTQRLSRMITIATGALTPSSDATLRLLRQAPAADDVKIWMATRSWMVPHPHLGPVEFPGPPQEEIDEVFYDQAPSAGEGMPPGSSETDDARWRALWELQQRRTHSYHNNGAGWGWEPACLTVPTQTLPQQESAACPRTPTGTADDAVVSQAQLCRNLAQLVLVAMTRLGAWIVGPLERVVMSMDPHAVSHLAARHYAVPPLDPAVSTRRGLQVSELYKQKGLRRPNRDAQALGAVLHEIPHWLDGTLQGLDSETVTLTSLLPECPTAELIYQHLWAAWHPLCRQHSPLCIPMTSRLGTALATHAGASCAGRPTTGNFATEWVLGQLTAGVVTAAGAQLYERHATITRCVTAALFYGLVTHGDADVRQIAREIADAARTGSRPPVQAAAAVYHLLDSNQGLQLLCVRSWVYHELSQRCTWDSPGLMHELEPDSPEARRAVQQLRRDRFPPNHGGAPPPLSSAPGDPTEVKQWVALYNCQPVLLHGCVSTDADGTRRAHRSCDLEEPCLGDPRGQESAEVTAWLAASQVDHGVLLPCDMEALMTDALSKALPLAQNPDPRYYARLSTSHAATPEALAQVLYNTARSLPTGAQQPPQHDCAGWWHLAQQEMGPWVCRYTMQACLLWAFSPQGTGAAPCTLNSAHGGGGGNGPGGAAQPSFDDQVPGVRSDSTTVGYPGAPGAPPPAPATPPLLTDAVPTDPHSHPARPSHWSPDLPPTTPPTRCAATPPLATPPTTHRVTNVKPPALAQPCMFQQASPGHRDPAPAAEAGDSAILHPAATRGGQTAVAARQPTAPVPRDKRSLSVSPGLDVMADMSRAGTPDLRFEVDALGAGVFEDSDLMNWAPAVGLPVPTAPSIPAAQGGEAGTATPADAARPLSPSPSDRCHRPHEDVRVLTVNLGTRGWGNLGATLALAEKLHCDVIVASETKLPSSEQLPPVVKGPTEWRVFHQQHRRGSGGVAVLARISAFTRATTDDVGHELPSPSAILVHLESKFLQVPLLVCGVYLPPPGQTSCTTDLDCAVAGCGLHHTGATIRFLGKVAHDHSATARLIVTGDLNADPTRVPGGEMQHRHHRWAVLAPALGLLADGIEPDAGGAGGTPRMVCAVDRPVATRPQKGKKCRASSTATTHAIVSQAGLSVQSFQVLDLAADQLSDHFPVVTTLRLYGVPTGAADTAQQPATRAGPTADRLGAAGVAQAGVAPIFTTAGAAVMATPTAAKGALALGKSHTHPPLSGGIVRLDTGRPRRAVSAKPRGAPRPATVGAESGGDAAPQVTPPTAQRQGSRRRARRGSGTPPGVHPAEDDEGAECPSVPATDQRQPRRQLDPRRALSTSTKKRSVGGQHSSGGPTAEDEAQGLRSRKRLAMSDQDVGCTAPHPTAGGLAAPGLDGEWTQPVERSGGGQASAQVSLHASPPPCEDHALPPVDPGTPPTAPSPATSTIRVYSANIGGGGASGWHARVSAAVCLARQQGAHIVIVQETHLPEGREAVLPPDLWPGAHVIRSSRVHRDPTKAWGGVAVIAALGGELGITQMVLEDQCQRCDCMWVRIHATAVLQPIFVCATYLPPHGMPSVCEDESACASDSCHRNHPDQGARYIAVTAPPRARKGIVIVAGDLNADALPRASKGTLQRAQTAAQRRWGFLCDTLGIGVRGSVDQDDEGILCLVSLNKQHPGPTGALVPTRTTADGRDTVLDHVLHVPTDIIISTSLQVLPIHLGDHAPLVATLQVVGRTANPLAPPSAERNPSTAPAARWTRPPIYLTTCNRSITFAGITVDKTALSDLRHAVDSWQAATGRHLRGQQFRVGLYTTIGRSIDNLRRGQRRGQHKETAGRGDRTAHELTTAMTEAHASLRRFQAQERDARAGAVHGEGGLDVNSGELQARILAYSTARAALKSYLQRKMRSAARARADDYLSASGRQDSRTVQRALRAALPDGKAGNPHPLSSMSTTMDVAAQVSARDVVQPQDAAGLGKQEVSRLAAQLHADALAKHFSDIGTADPTLSPDFLRTQQRTVAEAVAHCEQHNAQAAPGGPSAPSVQGTCLAEGDITPTEVEAALKGAKLEPSTLGTAMAALVAVYGGTDEDSVQRRETLARQLNDEWRSGDPDKDATTAVVTPIHKGGAPGDTGNYRTIAVGGALPKLLMLILKARLETHLLAKGVVHPLQAGFQRGRSTEEHLILCMMVEGRGRRRGQKPVTAFLDVRKAFGSVNHTILLGMLWTAGVVGHTWTYLRALLSRQQMVVKVDGQLSDPFPAQRGVPEGNVLSPLLFLLYINMVLTAVDAVDHPDAGVPLTGPGGRSVRVTVSIRAPSYADDIRLFATSMEGLQAMLTAMCRVLIDLRLQANIGVAKTAIFSPHVVSGARAQAWLPAQAVAGEHNGDVVAASNAEVYRYLGVMTDNTDDAAWEGEQRSEGNPTARPQYATHLARMTAVSNRGLHTIATSGVCSLPPAVAGRAYNTLLLPTITYGIAAWGSQCLPKVLYKNEKHAARMVARSGCLPLEVLFAVSGMGRLDDAYAAGVLRSLTIVCRSPRDSVLRLLAVKELQEWVGATPGVKRGMWINDVMLLLDELDAAAVWNATSAPCAHGTDPPCRPDGVAAANAPDMVAGGWRATAVRVLFWWAKDQVELPLTQEVAMVATMDASRRTALDVARLWRRVRTLWSLPSLRDVAVLSARLQPAPFAHVRRSRANQLRILARGGARSLLGWAVYNTHTRDGTTHACPLCRQPDGLAVMHLVAQCQGLQQLRARVWAKGVAFAAQRLSTGVASPLCEVMSTTPTDGEGVLVWAALTLGDEVGAVVAAAVACGQPKVPLWKDAGYASLLGITGELLVSMVAVLQEGAEVVPAATGE